MEQEITLEREINEETIDLLVENNEEYISLSKEDGGGTSDYEGLFNKPSINNVELVKNKSLDDLGIQPKLTQGDNVKIINNVISVPTANDAEEDNTRPITSAAVYTEIGNINVLLKTI